LLEREDRRGRDVVGEPDNFSKVIQCYCGGVSKREVWM
jgi:hypothetical protein